MVPGSGSATMPWIHWRAASICDRSEELILITPSSSMSTLAPVVATISRITLPPVPMTSRILSLGIDMVSALISLRQCDLHDLLGDAGDLDVHLQGGDAVFRAGDLEVHVAEMVLVAEDVADHREVLTFEDQAHGDARDGPRQRHAGVHQREGRAAD